MKYFINEHCRGCGMCAKRCPRHAIHGAIGVRQQIRQEKCLHCGRCFRVCRFGAVEELPDGQPLPGEENCQDAPAPENAEA